MTEYTLLVCPFNTALDSLVATLQIYIVLSSDPHALLQDGIYVYHSPSLKGFHISPPLLLTRTPSFDLDSTWIVHGASGL